MERRDFFRISAAAAAAAALSPIDLSGKSKKKEQVVSSRSDFNGVKIGAITYSYRSQGTTAGDMLLFALASGVGSVELMSAPALTFTGCPENKADWIPGTPEAEKCMAKFRQLGEIYRAAGVDIHIIKFSPKANMSENTLNYMFEACKAIGAAGVCTELDFATAEKVGPIAEKHGKYLIFHNHGQPSTPQWQGFDAYLKYGKNIMLNFDAGHYFGFTGKNPCEIVEKYHDRIYSIHLKDKTSIDNASAPNKNMSWGNGQTPLRELLGLVRKHAGEPGWPVHCDIELEYEVPQGSTSVEEVAKCVEYCRNILL